MQEQVILQCDLGNQDGAAENSHNSLCQILHEGQGQVLHSGDDVGELEEVQAQLHLHVLALLVDQQHLAVDKLKHVHFHFDGTDGRHLVFLAAHWLVQLPRWNLDAELHIDVAAFVDHIHLHFHRHCRQGVSRISGLRHAQ